MIRLVLALVLAATTTVAVAAPQQPQGTWAMSNRGRFHGYLSGGLMPKCNPWVSPECARLHPNLLRYVPPPQGR